MTSIESSIRKFELGAVSSFIGSAIGDVIDQFRTSQFGRLDLGSSDYISSVIAGAFAAPLIPKVSTLEGVVLSVGLNKALFDVIDRFRGGSGNDYSNLIRDFIFDSIIIYYLILILNQIIELIQGEEDEEDSVLEAVVISAVVNIYYTMKRD